MRFIHTADWHLGRLFYGVHLTEDQAYILDELVSLAKDARVDAVIIAGDIYDRAVPPPDAVRLLDGVLSRLVLDLKVGVTAIGGNHDSPDRVAFGSRVLAGQGLNILGAVDSTVQCVTLHDQHGSIRVYPIPYADPATVREKLESDEIRDQQTAVTAIIERTRGNHPPGGRSILVAHSFVRGGKEAESERPLSVGGADQVSSESFAGFDYVALGHLHRPQTTGSETIRYSGSLLKYSFSEADQPKSVDLVDMDATGACTIERITLTPRRDVRCVKGYLKDLMSNPDPTKSRNDYLMATLLDTDAILDAQGKLQQVYPNMLHIDRPHLALSSDREAHRPDHRKLNDLDLFAAFYAEVTGEQLGLKHKTAYEEVVTQVRLQEREVLP